MEPGRAEEADELRRRLLDPRLQHALSLDEVQRASRIFFGTPNLICLYGMQPAAYHATGVRIAARTAIECVIDLCAVQIADALRAAITRCFPGEPIAVLDLFAGSANLLHHVSLSAGARLALGFEEDDLVHGLTRTNLDRIGSPAILEHGDWQSRLDERRVPEDHVCIILLAPPWGAAFNFARGLDLRRTEPPIDGVVHGLRARLRGRKIVWLVQTHELLVADSVAAVVGGAEILAQGVTTGLAAGRNIGYLAFSP